MQMPESSSSKDMPKRHERRGYLRRRRGHVPAVALSSLNWGLTHMPSLWHAWIADLDTKRK
eukprot:10283532-Karenia_brevis.AAC.1